MRALTLAVVLLCAFSASAQRRRHKPPEAPPAPDPVQLRYPKIIEIDPAHVKGQYHQAGGVYLYERKSLPHKSMVHERESFREELISEL